LLKRISISLALLLLVGAVAWILWSPLKKASGGEEDISRTAAQRFSQKLSQVSSPPKGHFSKTWEFSQKELDSYIHYELAQSFPKGGATFASSFCQTRYRRTPLWISIKFRQTASAKSPLLSALLAGEHHLELLGKVSTQNKQGSYEIGLAFGSNEIPKPLVLGRAKLVAPKYPSAKPNLLSNCHTRSPTLTSSRAK
jgi:hypothetical protein